MDVSELDEFISPQNRLIEHGGELDRNKIIADLLHEKIESNSQDKARHDGSESPTEIDEKKVLDKWFSELADHEAETGLKNLRLSSAAVKQWSESNHNYTPQKVPSKKKAKKKAARSKLTPEDLTEKSEGHTKSTSKSSSHRGFSSEDEGDKTKQKARKRALATTDPPEKNPSTLSEEGGEKQNKKKRKKALTDKSDASETMSLDVPSKTKRRVTADNIQSASTAKAGNRKKSEREQDREGEESSMLVGTDPDSSSDQPLLDVSPPYLTYVLPLPGNSMDTQLVLHNRHSKLCAFLVRTTSPKNYLAKPNSGFIPPGKSQSLTFSARLTEIPKNQDRFQIKSVLVQDEADVKDAKAFWKSVERSRVSKQVVVCQVSGTPHGTLTDQPTHSAPQPKGDTAVSSVAISPTSTSSATTGNTDVGKEDELSQQRKTIFRYKEEIATLKTQLSSSAKNRNFTLLIVIFLLGIFIGHLATYFLQRDHQ